MRIAAAVASILFAASAAHAGDAAFAPRGAGAESVAASLEQRVADVLGRRQAERDAALMAALDARVGAQVQAAAAQVVWPPVCLVAARVARTGPRVGTEPAGS